MIGPCVWRAGLLCCGAIHLGMPDGCVTERIISMSIRNNRSDLARKRRLRRTGYRRQLEQAVKAEQQKPATPPAEKSD